MTPVYGYGRLTWILSVFGVTREDFIREHTVRGTMPSSRCRGNIPMSAKVDKPMQEFIDAEAERCGVTRAELMRRIFDDFRDSRREQLDCPGCGQTVVLNPCP